VSAEPREASRDQGETAFTRVLRQLRRQRPDVLAVCFVDPEGECVDYSSELSPFDAKVSGAHLQVITEQVRRSMATLGAGEPMELQILAEDRDMLARRVDDDYVLVVVARSGAFGSELMAALDHAVLDLRDEADLPTPSWDCPLEVETRRATGWEFAPTVCRQGSRSIRISDVLGRWIEPGQIAGGELVCFRVRSDGNQELTLAYDRVRDRWLRW
jgi:predicted regulator of Ras-like GTPase activity (Roadblock/LC7/MglB family)